MDISVSIDVFAIDVSSKLTLFNCSKLRMFVFKIQWFREEIVANRNSRSARSYKLTSIRFPALLLPAPREVELVLFDVFGYDYSLTVAAECPAALPRSTDWTSELSDELINRASISRTLSFHAPTKHVYKSTVRFISSLKMGTTF